MNNSKVDCFQPEVAIAPGETLRETIEYINMTQIELSTRTGLAPKTINEIIKGKSSITAETALKLERCLGVSAKFWINLESNYVETKARIKSEQELKLEENYLEKFSCYRELVTLGYVSNVKNSLDKVKELLRFFGVDSLSYVKQLEAVAFRKLKNTDKYWNINIKGIPNKNVPDETKILNNISTCRGYYFHVYDNSSLHWEDTGKTPKVLKLEIPHNAFVLVSIRVDDEI